MSISGSGLLAKVKGEDCNQMALSTFAEARQRLGPNLQVTIHTRHVKEGFHSTAGVGFFIEHFLSCGQNQIAAAYGYVLLP